MTLDMNLSIQTNKERKIAKLAMTLFPMFTDFLQSTSRERTLGLRKTLVLNNCIIINIYFTNSIDTFDYADQQNGTLPSRTTGHNTLKNRLYSTVRCNNAVKYESLCESLKNAKLDLPS